MKDCLDLGCRQLLIFVILIGAALFITLFFMILFPTSIEVEPINATTPELSLQELECIREGGEYYYQIVPNCDFDLGTGQLEHCYWSKSLAPQWNCRIVNSSLALNRLVKE